MHFIRKFSADRQTEQLQLLFQNKKKIETLRLTQQRKHWKFLSDCFVKWTRLKETPGNKNTSQNKPKQRRATKTHRKTLRGRRLRFQHFCGTKKNLQDRRKGSVAGLRSRVVRAGSETRSFVVLRYRQLCGQQKASLKSSQSGDILLTEHIRHK